MERIQIFEPAMCCSTGVCGPSVDQELIRITGAVGNLRKNGFNISRFNLTSDPAAFVQNQAIHDLLEDEGMSVLPATIADGKVVKKGTYPTNQELADWSGVSIDKISKKQQFQIKLNVSK
ncbi:arsenite efflux transporter metallochaperone ArsD [Sporolactobacillus nakayamae]|uniref:Arsenical resistance operon trans-acting repressor ArsD n=1 Tax=Sporolactobacillus nakayamae TaxID=269670 RepID=A0A1I2TJD6_9BACL|nr:arsenite efflux transporter metallochaperone ArsD [Sporolactobacillus nakayamae]SFG65035.1 Arsenical resistance operon trans-acting repressor ArsD [Sporolactobacillus nakayamae]